MSRYELETANTYDTIADGLDTCQVENDPVSHPSHYTQGKIECIDYILDKGFNFCRGNAVKYITRAGQKDRNKEIEDLKKAIWYIEKEIERIGEA